MKRIFACTETILIPVAVTTVTVYFGHKIHGRVRAIKYVPAATPLDTNADIVITGATTGVPILTKANIGLATVWFHPRVIPNLNTAGGTLFSDAAADIWAVDEQIKLVVTNAVAGEGGTMTIYVEEDQ